MEGITSCQSVSAVFVSVTKLLAIKTALIKGKPNNSVARGEGFANKAGETFDYSRAIGQCTYYVLPHRIYIFQNNEETYSEQPVEFYPGMLKYFH